MKKWEYMTRIWSLKKKQVDIDEDLNTLGGEGWEICGTYRLNSDVVYTFKKEIQE